MESLSILIAIVGVALSYWLITSSRFRKDLGNKFSATIGVHTKTMVESAEVGRMNNRLDAIQDLADQGLDKEAVTKRLTDFDEIFMGVTPVATATKGEE